MPKKTAKSADEIQTLLDERLKILQWLERLELATDDTPSDVRNRVRSDYESRLDTVAEELKGFTQDLQETLAKHQGAHAQLQDREADAEARMAEAKLRHAVGEFPELKWNELHSGIMGELVKVREELKATDAEVSRLEEVLGMIEGRNAAAAEEPGMEEEPPSKPVDAPVPAGATAAENAQAAGSPESFDELAFLKSVTEDEGQGPAAAQAVGREVEQEPIKPMRVSQEVPAIPEVPADGREAASGPKKTLKCGECGVMNFPTEWYCERCGAELASL